MRRCYCLKIGWNSGLKRLFQRRERPSLFFYRPRSLIYSVPPWLNSKCERNAIKHSVYSNIQRRMGFLEVVIKDFNCRRKPGATVGQPALWQISSFTWDSGTQSCECKTTALANALLFVLSRPYNLKASRIVHCIYNPLCIYREKCNHNQPGFHIIFLPASFDCNGHVLPGRPFECCLWPGHK